LTETEGQMSYKFHMLVVYCSFVKVDQLQQFRDSRRDSGPRTQYMMTFRLYLIQTFCGWTLCQDVSLYLVRVVHLSWCPYLLGICSCRS